VDEGQWQQEDSKMKKVLNEWPGVLRQKDYDKLAKTLLAGPDRKTREEIQRAIARRVIKKLAAKLAKMDGELRQMAEEFCATERPKQKKAKKQAKGGQDGKV
jgi:hypothetical protein